MQNVRNLRLIIIGGIVFVVMIVAAVLIRGQLQRHDMQETYEEAMQMILDEEYDRARTVLATLPEYRDATVLMNYALARSEMDHGDAGQAEVMLETIPLDYEGDLAEEIKAYKSRGFDEALKNLQSTMDWLNELSEEGTAGGDTGTADGEGMVDVTGDGGAAGSSTGAGTAGGGTGTVGGGTGTAGPSTGSGTAGGGTGAAGGGTGTPSQSATPTPSQSETSSSSPTGTPLPEGEASGAAEGTAGPSTGSGTAGGGTGTAGGGTGNAGPSTGSGTAGDGTGTAGGGTGTAGAPSQSATPTASSEGEPSGAAEGTANGGTVTSTEVPVIEVPEPPHP